jgi:predicted SprT family Zn-dependent metalloprotease|tara:strand:+ start:312 stop:986 length:675 start_codon:yes stop_codon:yes gene_type:complete
MVTGGINKAVQEHARTSLDWKHQVKADKAYTLYGAVNDFLYQQNLPTVVIGFDDRLKKAGEYYFEGDNISLKHHFDMRTDLTKVETVIAVLHNAVHAYQDIHKPKGQWYHTKIFRDEMNQWGVATDKNGDAVSIDPVVFVETLTKIGADEIRSEIVDYEAVEADVTVTSTTEPIHLNVITPKSPSKGKQKKWSCACNPPVNVRCAVNLEAYCTKCMTDFEKQDQ